VTVRDLAWGDFPALLENYLAVYDEVRTNPDVGIGLFPEPPKISAEAEWFARLYGRVQDGTSIAVVAEEGGRAVGMCGVDRKGEHREVRHIGVLGILVARDWRGRGIGRRLLEAAIERCRGRFERIELSVFASNEGARRLYRSVGFVAWGLEPGGVLRDGRHTDLEYMILSLAPTSPPYYDRTGGPIELAPAPHDSIPCPETE